MEIHLTKKADLEFPDVAIATAIEEPSDSAATHLHTSDPDSNGTCQLRSLPQKVL